MMMTDLKKLSDQARRLCLAVADFYHVSLCDMRSGTRRADVREACEAAALLCVLLHYSLPEVSKELDRRCDKVMALADLGIWRLNNEAAFSSDINKIIDILKNDSAQ